MNAVLFNCFDLSKNSVKCAMNAHIRMISEGSRDTETGVFYHHKNKLHFKIF